MGNFFRGIIRASSFFRKEIFEILRQPRLVVTLVLGPFLILFIFGIGYRTQSSTVRTLFVAQSNSPILAKDIQQFGQSMDLMLNYVGVTDKLSQALNQLQHGQVDLVIVEPVDATSTIKNNQQAVFILYHHEIDPTKVSYINYLGWLYAGVVNQQVLRSFAVQGQADAVDLHTSLQDAHQNVSAMRQALQTGNFALAQQKQQGLVTNVYSISQAVGISLGLLDGLQQTNGTSDGNPDPVKSTLTDLGQNTNQLGDSTVSMDARLTRLDKVDKDLTDLDTMLAEFQSISPDIIVTPFISETKSIANVQPSILDFLRWQSWLSFSSIWELHSPLYRSFVSAT